MKYYIGIDIGGTHTDFALMSSTRNKSMNLLHVFKKATSSHPIEGVIQGLKELQNSFNDLEKLHSITIGTTLVTNAVSKRHVLKKVLALRITDYSYPLPPCYHYDDDLKQEILGELIHLNGKMEICGRGNFSISHADLEKIENALKRSDYEAISICSAYANLYPQHELYLQQKLKEVFGNTYLISTSHKTSSDSFYLREAQSILNASLTNYVRETFYKLREELSKIGVRTQIYFTDGLSSKRSVDDILEYPLNLVGSGPSNSLRGALYLSGLKEAVVIDVGGTTIDIGYISGDIEKGMCSVQVSGCKINATSADTISLPIGGGSVIENGIFTKEYCKDLSSMRSFGGHRYTLTDYALSRGLMNINGAFLKEDIPINLYQELIVPIESAITENLAGRNKPKVIVVGGGAGILKTVYQSISFGACANAVGAALSDYSVSEKCLTQSKNQFEVSKAMIENLKGQLQKKGIPYERQRVIENSFSMIPYSKDGKGKVSVRLLGSVI